MLKYNTSYAEHKKLSDKEDEVNTFSYDLVIPIDSAFNRTKSFQYLCILTGHAKTDRQLVQFVYLIFIKTTALWTP